MSYGVFEFIKHGSQEGRARLSHKDSFVERFLDGTINIAVDLRIKHVDEMIRVWIVCRSEDIRRGSCFDLEVKIADQKSQASEARMVFADMAIENREGIEKGRLDRTFWQSMLFGNSPRITPPFWWITGHLRADASAFTVQSLKYGPNGDLAADNNLFRHPADSALLSTIRGLGWSIDESGVAIESLDERIEVVDAFYGPFN